MMQEKKCLLFHCSRYNPITPAITMGLLGLADLLTREGFPSLIIHTGVEEKHYGDFDIARYLHPGLKIAGASAHWFPMTAESLDILKEVKKKSPGVFTLLGGYSASFFALELLQNYPWIDGVIRGDGEKPLLALSRELEKGNRNLSVVPNLVWRDNESIRENAFSYVGTPEDLEGLSLGNFSLYLHHFSEAMAYFYDHDLVRIMPSFLPEDYLPTPFYLLTGKGCTFNCPLCGGGAKAQEAVNNRKGAMFLPTGQVLKTIKEAETQGFQHFYISFDPRGSESFYEKMISALEPERDKFVFFLEFWQFPPLAILEAFNRIARELYISISPETINEELRKKVKKGIAYSNKELYYILNWTYDRKIHCFNYFSYFQPFETLEDMEATRRANWEINARYPFYVESFIGDLSTDPAAPVYREPEKFNCTLEVTSLEDHLRMARKIGNENIVIHSNNLISRDEQLFFHKKVRWDIGIKHLFKIYIKLFTRAFMSAEDVTAFMDRFYQTYAFLAPGTSSSSPLTAGTVKKVFALLEEMARMEAEAYRVKAYLPELIRYVQCLEIMKYEDFLPPEEGPPFSLPGYVRMELFHSTVHTACEELVQKKKFTEILFPGNGWEEGVIFHNTREGVKTKKIESKTAAFILKNKKDGPVPGEVMKLVEEKLLCPPKSL